MIDRLRFGWLFILLAALSLPRWHFSGDTGATAAAQGCVYLLLPLRLSAATAAIDHEILGFFKRLNSRKGFFGPPPALFRPRTS